MNATVMISLSLCNFIIIRNILFYLLNGLYFPSFFLYVKFYNALISCAYVNFIDIKNKIQLFPFIFHNLVK